MSPNCIRKIMIIGLTISELWHFNSGHLGPNRAKNEVFGTQKSEYQQKKFFFRVVSMGHGIILLYLGWEGSRSKGAVPAKECPKSLPQTELAPLDRIEGPQNQRFLRLPRVARPCRGQLGRVRAEHRTEESLIQPPPPVLTLPEPLEWPYSHIRAK